LHGVWKGTENEMVRWTTSQLDKRKCKQYLSQPFRPPRDARSRSHGPGDTPA
jgi:hypothetical protein